MSKRVRNKTMCHATKERLIALNGTRCMLCRKDFGNAITHHHLIPVSTNGKDDYENGSLLCSDCQVRIHRFDYGSFEYTELTTIILSNKQS